jgi:hypothetical protein
MHAIGVPEGVTLIKFEQELSEEPQAAQEPEVPAGEGVNEEDLLECHHHQPSSFLKGKHLEHYKPPMLFINDNLSPYV